MTLRSSLIIFIAGVLVLTLLAGSVLTYLSARAKVETEMQAAIAVGGRVALNAVDDVEEAANARRRLSLLVADFDGDRHLRARVMEGDKTVLSSTLAEPSDPAPDWFYRLLKGEPRSLTVPLPPQFEGLGRFVLETDSRNEVGEVWGEVTNTLTILALFCSLILVLIYATLGRALRPLEDLSRAFAEIGTSGPLPHVSESGPVELKRVYQGFNRMVERLALTEEQNRELQEQLATVQEEERNEIARDLHDEIGPFLFAVDVDAATVQQLIDAGRTEEVRLRLKEIRDSVGHMQKHVKDILARVRPAALTDFGLAHAVNSLVAFWLGRHPDVRFEVDVPAESYGEPHDGTIYRVIQESLSNAVRHGRPKSVAVRVAEEGGRIAISVRDDGSGLARNGSRSGFGIRGMRERVTLLGGELEISDTGGGNGVLVAAWLPAPPRPSAAPMGERCEGAASA